MTGDHAKALKVFAPAKVNLYLHVTGRRDNGYHELDSLIGFADIGDDVQITPAKNFGFEITGPFANAFRGRDIDNGPESSNLVVRAVWALSRLVEKAPAFHITLTKNLPLGAGIGGGSADAAAIIWGLLEYWGLPTTLEGVDDLLLNLGADVPVCFACETMHVSGIGERLERIESFPEMPIVLVHPGKACSTQEIFGQFDGEFKKSVVLPSSFQTPENLFALMLRTENMLSASATYFVPEIENVLNALNAQSTCAFARMSGSGSSCFGLFTDVSAAEKAAQVLAEENPDWWVKSGWLGRAARY